MYVAFMAKYFFLTLFFSSLQVLIVFGFAKRIADGRSQSSEVLELTDYVRLRSTDPVPAHPVSATVITSKRVKPKPTSSPCVVLPTDDVKVEVGAAVDSSGKPSGYASVIVTRDGNDTEVVKAPIDTAKITQQPKPQKRLLLSATALAGTDMAGASLTAGYRLASDVYGHVMITRIGGQMYVGVGATVLFW